MSTERHVTGLKELYRVLQSLPVKMERNVMRGALRAGANVILDQAKANVPVAEPSQRNRERYGAYAGALRDSGRVGGRARGGKVTAYVRFGGGKTKAGVPVFWAGWVEYGTKPHPNGRRGYHPGARPHPFLRPAADTKQSESVVAVGRYVYKRLSTQTGWDLSDVAIEAEE